MLLLPPACWGTSSGWGQEFLLPAPCKPLGVGRVLWDEPEHRLEVGSGGEGAMAWGHLAGRVEGEGRAFPCAQVTGLTSSVPFYGFIHRLHAFFGGRVSL